MTLKTEKPEGSRWTDDQWQAIAESGKDLLVAAAAGSGKTAVLVERIIRKLTDEENPVDVDRLLIVTFTNASAQEMKTRIAKALEKELEKNPSSLFLRRQMALLNRAQITTSHAFCMSVVRKYYYHLDIDPSFRVLDQTEMTLIREEVMEELFESYYAEEDNNAFFELVDRYSNDRSDLYLQELIQKIYDFSRSHPWPKEWLSQLADTYQNEGKAGLDDYPWINEAKRIIRQEVEGLQTLLLQAEQTIFEPGGPLPYSDAVLQDKAVLRNLQEGIDQDWKAMEQAFAEATFAKLKTCKGEEYSEDLKDQVKALRDQMKKSVKSLQEAWFFQSIEDHLNDLNRIVPSIHWMVRLVNDFHERYQTIKKDRSVVDFNDLEHFALEILREQGSEPDSLTPSAVAKLYQTQFEEVMVDEYQDTNLVQESVLQLVSRRKEGQGHLFMVGDVKQSIYRFRLAEPGLFLNKYKTYRANQETGIKIDLAKNFRSRTEVIDGTNFIFRQIMDEQVAEMDYNEEAELKLGAAYPKADQSADVIVINREKKEESSSGDPVNENELDADDLQTAELEALEMATQIKQMIGTPEDGSFQVFDKETERQRNVQFRDIVILLRAAQQAAPVIIDVFKQMGIPAHAELSTGYFDAIEVTNMLSVLKTIDNPYQDIPLAGVLRSPIGGLTGEELADIRLEHPEGPYFEAVKNYSHLNNTGAEKLRAFLGLLEQWRNEARVVSVAELIWQIYRDTGYYDYAAGLVGGSQRQANLKALYDRAIQYEKTSFRGLFRFLRFIDRMREQGNDLGAARALSEQEDVVRIMTIHKSKGLEYPVVFVAGLNKMFNKMDINRKTLLHKTLGLGTKFIDPVQRLSYPTLPYLTMKAKLTEELLAEEMRVLYVALTRAQEKLYLVATVRQIDQWLGKRSYLMQQQDWLLPPFMRRQARSFFDWIGAALMRHRQAEALHERTGLDPIHGEVKADSSHWNVQIKTDAEVTAQSVVKEEKTAQDHLRFVEKGEDVPVETSERQKISDRLNWRYRHRQAAVYMAKQSVTEIKRQQGFFNEEVDRTMVSTFKTHIGERPLFMQQKQRLSASEIGTTLHMVMQQLDFSNVSSLEALKRQGETLVEKEILTKEQEETIDYPAISAFFDSTIGRRLLQATKVYRESPFTLSLPAQDAYADWSGDEDEHVLVQGVIDCIFEDEEGLVLLDYKTDALKDRFKTDEQAAGYLKEHYAKQLNIYKQAIERIWKKKVDTTGLYAFDKSLFVVLNEQGG